MKRIRYRNDRTTSVLRVGLFSIGIAHFLILGLYLLDILEPVNLLNFHEQVAVQPFIMMWSTVGLLYYLVVEALLKGRRLPSEEPSE